MADFPAAIFSQRTIANVSGVVFDATKTTRIFAEDLQDLADEISEIETILGVNVNGSYLTVLAWLQALDSAVAAASVTILTTASTIDDSNTAFVFASKPKIIYKNGVAYRENHGWTWAGSTATLTAPVGTGGDIFAI